MTASLWHSLEILSTQAALLKEWQEELGDDFEAARPFLRPTEQQAGSYPCPHVHACGCRHRVVFESPEDISALCDCEEGGCDPIFLRPSDLIIYCLDSSLLAGAIRLAFGFTECESVGSYQVRSRLVGRWGLRRSHVFFSVPISVNGLLREIERLCAMVPSPFVLLTPTSRFCSPPVQRALERHGCAHLALAGILSVPSPGLLELAPVARITVDTSLADFGKRAAQGRPLELAVARVEAKLDALAKAGREERNDEVPEDTARQALALVQQLDVARRLGKPTLLTVFRLYCVNNMSATQVARQCGCSKTAIMKRLKIISEKIGMPAGRLRQYSAQFERMEDTMTDSRAKNIYREGLVHGEADDDGDHG